MADLRSQVDNAYQIARGMQELELSECALNGEGDEVDKALISLDHIHAAKYYSHVHDNKVYCKAKLLEGKIFLTTVQNKSKAKSCFETIVKNPAAKSLHTEEYSEAMFFLEKLEAEAQKAKKPDMSKTTLKHELTDELQKLDKAKVQDDLSFIDFLFSTFPPKHKENCRKPEISERSPKKKAYIRLCTYYHPDKVDTSVHGLKYQVLCEEISKRVNERFARM